MQLKRPPTQTASLGKILDLRNKERAPSLSSLSRRPSAELKEMCITAYSKQIDALIEIEGEEAASALLNLLRNELREVKKIDAEKADKSARKYENSFEGGP